MTDTKKAVNPSLALIVGAIVVAISYWFVPTTQQDSSGSSATTLDAAAGVKIDKPTGFSFPLEQDFVSAGKQMQLVGVGTRKKAIINVYSVGFYGAKQVMNALNNNNNNKQSDSGDEKKSRCDAILNTNKGAKAATLKFNMGVGAEKMAEALSNIEGVEQATKDSFGEMILDGIGGKLKKGESMTLEWKPPESVFVTARGAMIGEVKNKALYQGLLNVYLGPKSVSPALKQDIEAAATAKE